MYIISIIYIVNVIILLILSIKDIKREYDKTAPMRDVLWYLFVIICPVVNLVILIYLPIYYLSENIKPFLDKEMPITREKADE